MCLKCVSLSKRSIKKDSLVNYKAKNISFVAQILRDKCRQKFESTDNILSLLQSQENCQMDLLVGSIDYAADLMSQMDVA